MPTPKRLSASLEVPERKPRKPMGKPPASLEAAFSPVEIDFFQRAADMYADDYDVWEDFKDLN